MSKYFIPMREKTFSNYSILISSILICQTKALDMIKKIRQKCAYKNSVDDLTNYSYEISSCLHTSIALYYTTHTFANIMLANIFKDPDLHLKKVLNTKHT